jgi:hypothetical protein
MSENPEPGSWPIQPDCGAGIYGYNSEELEKMCAGLGEFAETIYSGFGTTFIKVMVYTANEVFCIRIYFEFQSPCRNACQISQCATRTPSMSLRLRVARGFLHVVIMEMHAAVRMALHRGRGVIKHGTLRTATYDAVFFVFDMLASDWLGCGASEAQ